MVGLENRWRWGRPSKSTYRCSGCFCTFLIHIVPSDGFKFPTTLPHKPVPGKSSLAFLHVSPCLSLLVRRPKTIQSPMSVLMNTNPSDSHQS
jgi:hypothetical protein